MQVRRNACWEFVIHIALNATIQLHINPLYTIVSTSVTKTACFRHTNTVKRCEYAEHSWFVQDALQGRKGFKLIIFHASLAWKSETF